MPVRWGIAFSIALAAWMAGCRSMLPVRSADSDRERQVDVAAEDEPVKLTAHSEPAAENSAITLTVGEDAPTEDVSTLPATLTLSDVEKMALQRSPALAVDGARIHAAYGRHEQAGLYPNPVVGYHATEIGNLGTAGQQGGFLSQRIITGDKLRLDQAVASQEIQSAEFQFDIQRRRVLNDARTRFYGALVALRRLKLTKELADVGDRFAASSRKLLKAKQATENDLLQAEIEAESAHILADNARNQNAEALRRLAAAVGVTHLDNTALSGNLNAGVPQFDWQNSYAMLMGTSPELAAARARIDRSRFAVQRARREVIPNIDVSVSIRHHNVTGDDVANVQVGFPIPILDRNQGNIRKARAELIAAEHSLKRIELDLQDRLAIATRRYANARQQVQRYSQQILPRAKKSLQLVKTGYDKQQVNYLTLLTSQRTYFQVSLLHLDAVWELRQAAIAIDGQLLSGSLSQR
ncbi:MAG: TolC family protein [Planctomycetes bacterium]|nr:TolC family protein [Planctomycetota bacterium]